MLIYYVGVFKVLQSQGVLGPAGHGNPPAAGASSGALTAAAVCSGTPEDRFYKIVSSDPPRRAAGPPPYLPPPQLDQGTARAARVPTPCKPPHAPAPPGGAHTAAPLQVRNLTDTCARRTCAGHMDRELRTALKRLLPSAAARVCNGSAFFSVSVLESPAAPALLRGELVSNWTDLGDMINTLVASSWIPGDQKRAGGGA